MVRCVTLSHDGNMMATGCDDGSVRVCSFLLLLFLFLFYRLVFVVFAFFVMVPLFRSLRYALFPDYTIFHFKIEGRGLTLLVVHKMLFFKETFLLMPVSNSSSLILSRLFEKNEHFWKTEHYFFNLLKLSNTTTAVTCLAEFDETTPLNIGLELLHRQIGLWN